MKTKTKSPAKKCSLCTTLKKQEQDERSAISRQEVAHLIRDRAKTGEFWTIMFDEQNSAFAHYLNETYYSGCELDVIGLRLSCPALQTLGDGAEVLALSLRRRRMLAPALVREFEAWLDTTYTSEELVSALCIFAVEARMLLLAVHVADHLFEERRVKR